MGAGDTHTTPVGLVPGVFIHAHLLDTLLTGRRIWRSFWVDWGLIALLGLGMPAMLAAFPTRWVLLVTVTALAVVVALCCLAMTRGYWVGLVVPVGVLIGSSLLAAGRNPSAPKSLPELDPLE